MMQWAVCENTNPISQELFQAIVAATPPDKAILEFGSGLATSEMLRYRKVISIEHNQEWCNKYHDNYLFVPVDGRTGFYEKNILTSALRNCTGLYGSLLVDGPDTDARTDGLLKYLTVAGNELSRGVPWFFDDTAWPPFVGSLQKIVNLRGGELFEFECTAKQWGVIPARRGE